MSSIQHLFSEKRTFNPSYTHQHFKNLEEYKKLYHESLEHPDLFWSKIAEDFFWYKSACKAVQFPSPPAGEGGRRSGQGQFHTTKWFEGAQTNICYNALDRHLPDKANQIALIWEGNEPFENKHFTFQELHREVCQLANALKSLGVKKGDRVAVYMGMTPELPMTLLACARIGAIHNVIFGGFSAESLKERIQDCGAKFVVTADALYRGNKIVPLKKSVDVALQACETEGYSIEKCLVLQHTGDEVEMKATRDVWWHEFLPSQNEVCEAEKMEAEDPLFILYTSGSTGKPKGVVHTTAGYMVYVATTFKYLFNASENDVFWCTADAGWVTGHSYLIYGPLLNGTTTLMFEGVPHYPEPDRFWEIIDKHQVNIFYTAPTALRALMREGNEWVKKHDLSSLKLLGTVGEPINPEAWMWYYEVVGKEKCPIIDTWWQTETGGIMVSSIPGIMPIKPGSAGLPFFGVKAKVIREDQSECAVDEGGLLVIEQAWPSMLRTVWGQPERVKETYFSKFPALYFAGDGARKDEDNYIWFLGRVDDVLNVSGHRIGTAELESAFVKHPSVAEAAVVGFPHAIKGQGIYAFVTLKKDSSEFPSPLEGEGGRRSGEGAIQSALIQHIVKEIGAIAKPDKIQLTPALPKTRSGKIMRRILRKIAEGDIENLGDISTLADPSVVDELLKNSCKTQRN